ncbi:MAG: GDP-mannose 4,6-dehydratase, partial [Candidatus Omnitrophica bacterium]|nr:GDP-mannose 4,6-dehydratase [Candidatus Omnitrophota bacterium]
MKRFLVTGGAGFIGSNFIRYLLKNNSDVSVINLDKLTYAGNLENLRDLESDSKYQFVHGDICNARLVEQLLQKVDWVVHFASETHVDRSIDCADDFIQTNVVGTRVLLDAVRLTGRIHRFLHFSTDEVYGSTAQGEFSEDAPFQPTSPYSASKAAADLMVQAYQKTHKVPAIILRGCNNYGPYQYPEKVIPLFITNLLEEKKVPLYSHGENSREWIYVEDTCRAIMLVSEKG